MSQQHPGVERFVRYVKINTQSNETIDAIPTNPNEIVFMRGLQAELDALGLKTDFDEQYCVLYAELAATNGSTHSLGFLTHVDTAPDAPGENVKPLFHTVATPAQDIQLPFGSVIPRKDLVPYEGMQVITSSGDTLLGADDKSGVAIVMTFIERVVKENVPHPRLVLIFTPDEEIGRSSDHVDLARVKLDSAYSVDGDEMGTYSDEGFNAWRAELTVTGVEIHPGSAYGVMEDAGYIMAQYVTSLPQSKRPETTRNDEGYIWCTSMSGGVSRAKATFIIRSFRTDEMEFFKSLMADQCGFFRTRYPHATLHLSFKHQYDNMKEFLPNSVLADNFVAACKKAGIVAKKEYMRGGSDCSALSARGLPAINIFAGGINFHSTREFVPVDAIVKGVDLCVQLVQLF